jgi:hypothetical protein
MLGFLTACTHTTKVEPGRPSAALVAAQVAVADRDIKVRTVSGEETRIGRVDLTADSIHGAMLPLGGTFRAPLTGIDRFSYKSRWTGIRDWVLLGAVGGAVGFPAMFAEECDGCIAWAASLAPIGALVGAIYGVAIGSIFGSTIEFQIRPGG